MYNPHPTFYLYTDMNKYLRSIRKLHSRNYNTPKEYLSVGMSFPYDSSAHINLAGIACVLEEDGGAYEKDLIKETVETINHETLHLATWRIATGQNHPERIVQLLNGEEKIRKPITYIREKSKKK